MNRHLSALIVPLALGGLITVGACSSTSDVRLTVTGTDDACEASLGEVPAGAVTFDFANEASKVSELYVLREDGSVVTEVENVAPGTKRTFTAKLDDGTFDLVCKPGQSGDGFRTELVAGSGTASAQDDNATVVEVTGNEYSFAFDDEVTLVAGGTYRFVLRNTGDLAHEMEVFGPDGEELGEIAPVEPDHSGSLTITLDEAGEYRFVCGLEGHEASGMVLNVDVAAPAS